MAGLRIQVKVSEAGKTRFQSVSTRAAMPDR